jgi:putative hemolysin
MDFSPFLPKPNPLSPQDKLPMPLTLLPPGADLTAPLTLRAQLFRHGAPDGDAQDPLCHHLLLSRDGIPRATARFRPFGPDLSAAYAAQSFDLSALRPTSALEIGRLCSADPDPTLLRQLWGALAGEALRRNCDLLFGTASLPKAKGPHGPTLAALAPFVDRQAPKALRPALPLQGPAPDPAALPPLLRFYLALGARLAPEAVPDPDLDTLQIFTCLRPAALSPARARAFAALAQDPIAVDRTAPKG